MRTTIKEIIAREGQPPEWAVAWKYADPIEGARWVTEEEAIDIRGEDPSLLVWIEEEE